MTTLPDRLRQEASELQQATEVQLNSITKMPDGDLDLSIVLQYILKAIYASTMAIIGMNRAATKVDLADVIEYQQTKTIQLRLDKKRKEIVDRSNALRDSVASAVTTGDWSDFDERFGQLFTADGESNDDNDG